MIFSLLTCETDRKQLNTLKRRLTSMLSWHLYRVVFILSLINIFFYLLGESILLQFCKLPCWKKSSQIKQLTSHLRWSRPTWYAYINHSCLIDFLNCEFMTPRWLNRISDFWCCIRSGAHRSHLGSLIQHLIPIALSKVFEQFLSQTQHLSNVRKNSPLLTKWKKRAHSK